MPGYLKKLQNQSVAKELARCHGLALRNIAATVLPWVLSKFIHARTKTFFLEHKLVGHPQKYNETHVPGKGISLTQMLQSNTYPLSVRSSVTYLDQTSIFEWWVVRCKFKNRHQERHVFNTDWTTCSKFVNHTLGSMVNIIGRAYVAFLWLTVSGLR